MELTTAQLCEMLFYGQQFLLVLASCGAIESGLPNSSLEFPNSDLCCCQIFDNFCLYIVAVLEKVAAPPD